MSRHAVERLKERGGIPKRAAEKELARVRDTAMPVNEMNGGVRGYFSRLAEIHQREIVLGDNDMILAIAGDGEVITVMRVPQELRAQARKQLARWKARWKVIKKATVQ